jgi:GAF domain-containing protein
MLETEALIVRDAQLDPRFADNALVTGEPDVRFYVGVPLRSSDCRPIGALCGIDRWPRDVDEHELALLADLANLTMEQLEQRLVATLDGLTGRGPFILSAARDIALAR